MILISSAVLAELPAITHAVISLGWSVSIRNGSFTVLDASGREWAAIFLQQDGARAALHRLRKDIQARLREEDPEFAQVTNFDSIRQMIARA
jgi:hypothetical protein